MQAPADACGHLPVVSWAYGITSASVSTRLTGSREKPGQEPGLLFSMHRRGSRILLRGAAAFSFTSNRRTKAPLDGARRVLYRCLAIERDDARRVLYRCLAIERDDARCRSDVVPDPLAAETGRIVTRRAKRPRRLFYESVEGSLERRRQKRPHSEITTPAVALHAREKAASAPNKIVIDANGSLMAPRLSGCRVDGRIGSVLTVVLAAAGGARAWPSC
jgi:hypothetical protein